MVKKCGQFLACQEPPDQSARLAFHQMLRLYREGGVDVNWDLEQY